MSALTPQDRKLAEPWQGSNDFACMCVGIQPAPGSRFHKDGSYDREAGRQRRADAAYARHIEQGYFLKAIAGINGITIDCERACLMLSALAEQLAKSLSTDRQDMAKRLLEVRDEFDFDRRQDAREGEMT